LYVNPALAGAQKCGRIALNYRNQWTAIPGAFSSINASFDKHFDELSGALGFIVTNVREGNGSYSTTNAGAIYSYNIQVNDMFSIKTAVQASFVNRHIYWNELTFPDQFNEGGLIPGSTSGETLPNTPTSKNYADFSTGIVGYSENFYAGFAVHHLTRPNEGFMNAFELPMKFTVHAGAVIDLIPKQRRFRDPGAPTLSPNIIYQQQGTAQHVNYGVYLNYSALVLGAWYRQTIAFNQPDCVTFLVGIRYNAMRIGYSYDLALNKLLAVSGGSHEISLGYNLRCAPPRPQVRMINCPSF
jgi:type IX secretion system PorP/SprF family membrane protein